MNDFIGKLEFWQAMALLGAINIPILIIIFGAKPYIKIGRHFLFGMGHRKVKPGESPHEHCPHQGDIAFIQVRTIEVASKAVTIDLSTKLDTLMAFVEEKLVAIKSLLVNNYSQLLQSRIAEPKNVTAHEDYNAYVFLVETVLFRILKDLIKAAIKQNSLEKKSETEFNAYVEAKFKFLYEKGSEFMDAHYLGEKMVLSREELRVSVFQLKDKFEDLCREGFYEARRIMRDKEAEKQKLWDELFGYTEQVMGKNFNNTSIIKK